MLDPSKNLAASGDAGESATPADLVSLSTQAWLDKAVRRLGLCPFAEQARGSTRIVPVSAENAVSALSEFSVLAERFHEGPVETLLVPFSAAFDEFESFCESIEVAQRFLEAAELDAHLQLASFHPAYLFADAPASEASHFTNRAPFPTLQLLRVSSVHRAIEDFGDTRRIFEANIRRVSALSFEAREALRCPIGVRVLSAETSPAQSGADDSDARDKSDRRRGEDSVDNGAPELQGLQTTLIKAGEQVTLSARMEAARTSRTFEEDARLLTDEHWLVS